MAEKKKILVKEKISDQGVENLKKEFEVVFAPEMSREEMLEAISDCHALIVRSATKVDAEVIQAGKSLQVIGRAGVGVDNIEVEPATKRGIMVINAPQSNIISAAEHTMTLIMSLCRHIPDAVDTTAPGALGPQELRGSGTVPQDHGHPGPGPHRHAGGRALLRLRHAGHRLRPLHLHRQGPEAGGGDQGEPGRVPGGGRLHHRPPAQEPGDPSHDRGGRIRQDEARRVHLQRGARGDHRRGGAGRGAGVRQAGRGRPRRVREGAPVRRTAPSCA